MTRLTIGITTRNRPEALRTCIESIRLLSDLEPDVLVFDDASDPPAAAALGNASNVRVIRDETSRNMVAGRNRLVREARTPYVLLLDDDARIVNAEAVREAIGVLDDDPRIAAAGFAQAEADGRPWPENMQPSPAAARSVVPSFIGFAHLVRRQTFLEIGGYRELFVFYGEEKDLCLRLYEAGHVIVYDPRWLVAHVPAAQSRNRQRYLRQVARNDCLQSILNDPLDRMAWMVPARLLLYFRMRRRWGIPDPWGGVRLCRDVIRCLPAAWRQRRAVRRGTIAAWRRLRRSPAAYEGPAVHHA